MIMITTPATMAIIIMMTGMTTRMIPVTTTESDASLQYNTKRGETPYSGVSPLFVLFYVWAGD